MALRYIIISIISGTIKRQSTLTQYSMEAQIQEIASYTELTLVPSEDKFLWGLSHIA